MKGIIQHSSDYFKFFIIILSLFFFSSCDGITPAEPVIHSFTADSTTIDEGESVTLSWVTTGATTVYLGHTSESLSATGTVNSSGSKIVSPSETTTYTLTATNSAGSTNQSIIVTVNPAGIIGYPVRYITIQPGPEDEKFTTVINYLPEAFFSNTSYIFIGKFGGIFGVTRSLLQFDLSALPANASIMKAELKLYQFENVGTDNFTIAAHRVTQSWNKSNINWNNQPDYRFFPEYISTVSVNWHYWQSWDITTLVQGWLNGSIPNYGVVLKTTNESLMNNVSCINSYPTEDPFYYPKLEVTYVVFP